MAKLTLEELSRLFEGRSKFVDRLAHYDDPLRRAREVLRSLADEELREALNAHPRIGDRSVSAASVAERGTQEDQSIIAELNRLNRAYESKFGFRFVVFVNRRPRSQIIPVLRERLARTREQEVATAIDELVSIAGDCYREEGREKKEEGSTKTRNMTKGDL